MGLFDILSSVAEALADQGKREKERRERRQHRSNREIVDMYNDAMDGGSNYRKTARESISGYNGWYTCPHCGRKFRASQMDVDHIVPQSRGGGNTIDNLQYLCPHCNRSKGNRTDDTGRDLERRRKELRNRNKRDTDFLDEISRHRN